MSSDQQFASMINFFDEKLAEIDNQGGHVQV